MRPVSESSATSIELPTKLATESPLNRRRNLRGRVFEPVNALPGYCVRHGRPATSHWSCQVWSKPDIEDLRPHRPRAIAWLFHSAWDRPYYFIIQMQRALVVAAKWPLCARCTRVHRWGSRAAVALALIGALLILVTAIIGGVTGRAHLTTTVMFVAGAIMVPLALAPLSLCRVEVLLRAQTAVDGYALIVKNPHPAFADEARQIAEAHRASH